MNSSSGSAPAYFSWRIFPSLQSSDGEAFFNAQLFWYGQKGKLFGVHVYLGDLMEMMKKICAVVVFAAAVSGCAVAAAVVDADGVVFINGEPCSVPTKVLQEKPGQDAREELMRFCKVRVPEKIQEAKRQALVEYLTGCMRQVIAKFFLLGNVSGFVLGATVMHLLSNAGGIYVTGLLPGLTCNYA